jgi:hypothetical protein
MIDLLGKKMVTLILVCLFIAGGAGTIVYYYMLPQQEKLDRESKSLKSQIDGKRAEITRIRFEFDKIQTQITQFKVLEAKGFFNAQDRITARDATVALMRNAKLMDEGTQVSFDPARLVENEHATKAGYKLLSGPVKVQFSALNDTNVFAFMVLLDRAFPGYMQMKSLQISRTANKDFNATVDSLRQGNASAMVNGTAEFVWWSMPSEAQLKADPRLNPAQYTPEDESQQQEVPQ